MERLPSARGPISKRPWNQPTTLPSAKSWATRGNSCFLRQAAIVQAGSIQSLHNFLVV